MLKVNTLFIMTASILVLLMTPGLAFFYGGLVNRRHANNMLLTVFMMCGLAVILWITVGYSLSFSGNHWGIVGNLNNILMILIAFLPCLPRMVQRLKLLLVLLLLCLL